MAAPLLLTLVAPGEQALAQGFPSGAAEKAPETGVGRGVLVGVNRGAQAAAVTRRGVMLAPGIRLVPGGRAMLRRLRSASGVRWVERNRSFRASAPLGSGASALSDDPLLGLQWGLHGARGIRAPDAWWTSTGGEVTVAVLDTGIRHDHPDLAANLWTNPRETPANNVDDDRDGFTDDVHGADVVSGDGEPWDGFGHGTAVAGVIGARGGNGLGTAGVAWRVRLMAVKVLDDHGVGNTATVVAGIRYALAHGARVINLSVNGPHGGRALDEAIASAEAAGAVVVASAGNDAQSRDRVPSYPASVSSDALLSVASIARDGSLAEGSAWGPQSVDLAAPGAEVLTIGPRGHGAQTGTSFAAAHATGALALLAAARPDASAAELVGALTSGSRPSAELAGLVAHGELDVAAAMSRLVPGSGPRVRLLRRRARRDRRACLFASWKAGGDVAAIASYRLTVDGRPARLVLPAAVRRARRPCGRRLRPGRHRIEVKALDVARLPLASLTLTLRIGKPRRPAGKRVVVRHYPS